MTSSEDGSFFVFFQEIYSWRDKMVQDESVYYVLPNHMGDAGHHGVL